MKRESVTFRLDSVKRRAMDAIASARDRDRSYILNEAIDSYLETQRWQMEHIEEGVAQAQRGEWADPSAVKKAIALWRQR